MADGGGWRPGPARAHAGWLGHKHVRKGKVREDPRLPEVSRLCTQPRACPRVLGARVSLGTCVLHWLRRREAGLAAEGCSSAPRVSAPSCAGPAALPSAGGPGRQSTSLSASSRLSAPGWLGSVSPPAAAERSQTCPGGPELLASGVLAGKLPVAGSHAPGSPLPGLRHCHPSPLCFRGQHTGGSVPTAPPGRQAHLTSLSASGLPLLLRVPSDRLGPGLVIRSTSLLRSADGSLFLEVNRPTGCGDQDVGIFGTVPPGLSRLPRAPRTAPGLWNQPWDLAERAPRPAGGGGSL